MCVYVCLCVLLGSVWYSATTNSPLTVVAALSSRYLLFLFVSAGDSVGRFVQFSLFARVCALFTPQLRLQSTSLTGDCVNNKCTVSVHWFVCFACF